LGIDFEVVMEVRHNLALAFLLLLACTRESVSPPVSAPPIDADVMAWRERRVSTLRNDEGWLTVVGLEWLKPGVNTIGSSNASDVKLPSKVPERVGTMTLAGGSVHFKAASKSGVMMGPRRVAQMKLVPDTEGKPTVLEVGSLRFFVIKRGNKYGVRVKDLESSARKNFHGIDYYAIDPKWRVKARFEPYSPAKKIPITNVLGMTEDMVSPGALVFEVDGKPMRLDPVLEEGSDELFIIFGDSTNGRETYGAGRYLYAAKPGANQSVTVDFNKSYNPPCVFTDFATCPLPPSQNKLPIAVTAGEKNYDH
jgi:uncharacterized protein (DUF1684 family)